MGIPLKVLVLEDTETDYELLLIELSSGGYDAESVRIQTADSMKNELINNEWDIIIADYSIPRFDAMEALRILHKLAIDIPFIVISGTIGEEVAVEVMKAGARDYFIKDKMKLLCPAIARELREAEVRRQQRKAEENLIFSETKYRRLFETAKDGILILDYMTGEVQDANLFLSELLGLARGQLTGKKIWEFGFLSDVIANKENFEELKKKKYIRYDDLPLETSDGKQIDVEFVSNVYQANGHNVIQCNIRDITERVQAEHRDMLTQKLLELLNRQEQGPDLVREILLLIKKCTGFEALGIRLQEGEDFPYYEVNGFSEAFLKTESNLCQTDKEGKIVRDKKGRPVLECMCGNVLCGRTDSRLPFFTEGGSFWTNSTTKLIAETLEEDRQARTRNRCNGEGYESVALIPLRTEGAIIGLLQMNDKRPHCFTKEMIRFFEGIGASISISLSRSRSEEALRKSEERFRSIFEYSSIGKTLTLPGGRLLQINKAFADMFGYTVEELENISFEEITHPDDLELSRAGVRSLLANECSNYRMEKRYIHKNGSIVWTDVSTVLLRDKKGTPLYFITNVVDITTRKKLEEQLRHAMKIEAIGRLAGGVAHDFNNALTPIITFSDSLLSQLIPSHPMYEDIKVIRESGERCANLTRQLLAFGRRQAMDLKIINLNDVILNVEKMLSRVIRENIKLIKSLEPELGNVKADIGQIEQIIVNLAINASDAMPDGGNLNLETHNIILDEEYSKAHVSLMPGSYIMMVVSDTGCGINEEIRSHIFEPFFTTKEAGRGTGLGLSTVYGIVKQCGGGIWVYSEPGRGTAFKIYLPCVKESADKISLPKEVSEESLRGTETILLVEDDDCVRNLTNQILSVKGYNVLEAVNGEEALIVSSNYKNPIQLLISDIIMPGMSGKELAEKLIKSRPAIKVLYFSGYTENAIIHQGVLDKGINFIQKPFRAVSFAAKVRDILNEGSK